MSIRDITILTSPPAPVVGDDAGCTCCVTTSQTTAQAEQNLKEQETNVTTSTATYKVKGMTCDHCVNAVASELSELPGVQSVAVDLVAGGTSTVTVASEQPLPLDDVRAAVDEAGYELADS